MNKFWIFIAVFNLVVGVIAIILGGLILFAEYLKSRRENSEAYRRFKK